jgi:ectoine hydroxylase-related dioxygenase (phytanoyl-CoA dioxygenase family)
MQLVEYWIDNQRVAFQLEGSTENGASTVLLESDDNILRDSPWDDVGFCVAPSLAQSQLEQLIAGFTALIRDKVEEAGVRTDDGFCLEQYHNVVNDEQHAAVIKQTRVGFERHQFPLPLEIVERRISEICGVALTVAGANYKGRPFFLRIVRPHKPQDNNPPHRDVWLDHLRDGVNIYLPVAGSNALSSLPVLPGSHKWSENEIERSVDGAKIGGLNFTVPTVTSARMPLKMTRPNPLPAEVMVFSPYLIHGGAANLNDDMTRVSLEMRLWRRSSSEAKAA